MNDRNISPTKRFTPADRRCLAYTLGQAREARLYRRLAAVLLVAEGHSISEAARRMRVPRVSVQRWLARYLVNHAVSALYDAPRGGRPRTAQTLTQAQLAALLSRDPRAYGHQATTWTVPLLAAHLRQHERLAVSARTLRRRLREWRYRWKRPRYIYTGRAAHVGQKKGGLFAV